MEVYKSDFFSITKKDTTLIQQWSDKRLSPEKFKEELSIFVKIAQQTTHKSHLWLHENFTLSIPPELYQWLEDSVTSVLYKNGLRKLAYTVSPDVKSHLSVVNSFNHVQSVVNPLFFVDRDEARNYIESQEKLDTFSMPFPEYNVTIYEKEEFTKVEVKTHINDLPKLLAALNNIKSDKQLVLAEFEKFQSLTLREREVMRYLSLGCSNQEVASKLFLSLNTVKNHRKSIICKLEISSVIDFYYYSKAFGLIHF